MDMTLIVVSGAPGTGKSTVAAALAAHFGRPLFALDMIKEALADVLGAGDEDWSDRVGDAAGEIVFRMSAQFPEAVAEGWWRGTRRERAVRDFAGAVEVFCRCDPEVAAARMRGRHATGRHPIHRDVINPAMRNTDPATATFRLALMPACRCCRSIDRPWGRPIRRDRRIPVR